MHRRSTYSPPLKPTIGNPVCAGDETKGFGVAVPPRKPFPSLRAMLALGEHDGPGRLQQDVEEAKEPQNSGDHPEDSAPEKEQDGEAANDDDVARPEDR